MARCPARREFICSNRTDDSALLYPPPKATSTSKPNPNFYRPFQLLDNQFEARLKAVVEEEEERLASVGGKGLNGREDSWL